MSEDTEQIRTVEPTEEEREYLANLYAAYQREAMRIYFLAKDRQEKEQKS